MSWAHDRTQLIVLPLDASELHGMTCALGDKQDSEPARIVGRSSASNVMPPNVAHSGCTAKAWQASGADMSHRAAAYRVTRGVRPSTSRIRVRSSPSINSATCDSARRIVLSSIFG